MIEITILIILTLFLFFIGRECFVKYEVYSSDVIQLAQDERERLEYPDLVKEIRASKKKWFTDTERSKKYWFIQRGMKLLCEIWDLETGEHFECFDEPFEGLLKSLNLFESERKNNLTREHVMLVSRNHELENFKKERLN